jgi:UDP-N-acetylglucosamine/UDP-N-acetylgalactosamine diphosphorylase
MGLLEEQRKALTQERLPPNDLLPWLDITLPAIGEIDDSLIRHGKAAAVILSGGQGTRLGWGGPKALYPIVPQKNLTLLEILLQKIGKRSRQCNASLEVAVMTSTLTQQRFIEHAEQHDHYGLNPSQITFFPQKVLPLLDEEGNWFYEKPGRLAMGPDGNGSVFACLAESGLIERWEKRGIQAVSILPVDNPLADPFDPFLFHEISRYNCDIVAQAIRRIDPEEKLGLFVKQGEQMSVIEYTELSADQRYARNSDGSLFFPYGNLGGLACSLSLIKKSATTLLPWHIAQKKADAYGRGEILCSKCERFIFDILPLAKRSSLLLYSRENCYAPLKCRTGPSGPHAVLSKISHLIDLS